METEVDYLKQFRKIINGNEVQLISKLELLLLKIIRNKTAYAFVFSLYIDLKPTDLSIKEIFENVIANEFIKNTYVDYFIYFCHQSIDLSIKLTGKIISKIIHYDFKTIYLNCEKLSHEINTPLDQLLIAVLKEKNILDVRQALGFFNFLPKQQQALIFAKIITDIDVLNFKSLISYLDLNLMENTALSTYLHELCYDGSDFINELDKIQNLNMLNRVDNLMKILLGNFYKIPLFINNLLNKSEINPVPRLLFELSLHTETLRILLIFLNKIKDPVWTNKFLQAHKYHPDVKDLICFS